MTLYILDTDTLTLYQKADPQVVQRVQTHSWQDLAITVISVEEQLSGWYTKLRRVKKRDEVARVYQQLTENVRSLSKFQILSFTEPAIVRYEWLKAQRFNIGKMDLRIAAIVLENGGTLVSRNLRDFRRVPNLVTEDWSN